MISYWSFLREEAERKDPDSEPANTESCVRGDRRGMKRQESSVGLRRELKKTVVSLRSRRWAGIIRTDDFGED